MKTKAKKTTKISKTKKTKVKKIPESKLNKQLDKLWSQAVRARDGKCMFCGSTKNLQAHHIFSRRHQATRWIIENGITACYKDHIHGIHKDTLTYALKIMEIRGKDQIDILKSSYKRPKPSYEDKLFLKKVLEFIIREIEAYKKEKNGKATNS